MTNNGQPWNEFVKAMRSGTPVKITEEIFNNFLDVLPPVHMRYNAKLPGGRIVQASYGFAEGYEQVVAFWQDKKDKQYYCCRTEEWNPYA
jgi:hypothetical protein